MRLIRIPGADKAIITAEKLRDNLLNPHYRKGGLQAQMLLAAGYTPYDWWILKADLNTQHLSRDDATMWETEGGRRYAIDAPLLTPSGRLLEVQSVWMLERGCVVPTLRTLYPRLSPGDPRIAAPPDAERKYGYPKDWQDPPAAARVRT